ncbi:MAG: radical SAM protein, partial [Solobacterium sp.]|nr:radical SAM protein [Solobacterium sp.]
GLFLTPRCNLRCRHCFEWNEDGFLKNADPSRHSREIPLETIEAALAYTEAAKTRLYLWGGEPLLYSRFHELSQLLKKAKRWTTICTNGLLIDRAIEDLMEISDHTVLLISLDGFRDINDGIRGKGTFERVIANIALLREKGFRGEISVCTVLSDAMIGRVYEFCEYMETLNINTLYLSFPWYISEATAAEMDREFEQRFGDLLPSVGKGKASWHHFTWHISEDSIECLREEMKRIGERTWEIRVRFQPSLAPAEIDDFVRGGTMPAQQATKCLAVYNRMDILEGGEVSACKLFREFAVGNTNDLTIQEIWEGEKMKEIRRRMNCGLLPVCSKCVLLYLNGE